MNEVHIRIDQVMTARVATVPPDASLETIVATMRDRRLSCLVVCEERRPVGIVSERDLVRILGEVLQGSPSSEFRASEVMSAPVFAIPSSAPLHQAVALTAGRGFRRVAVVDAAGNLAGLVTQSDLLRAHVLEVEHQRSTLERTVAERTASLTEANRQLEELSSRDPLLEIGNRRAMVNALDHEHERARRYERPYAVVLVDVDHFKAYNDRYGHVAGDTVLRKIARALDASRRTSDTVHRYGGEEMILVLPETRLDGAQIVAERARAAVEALGVAHQDSAHGTLTISAGIAEFLPGTSHDGGWPSLVERADGALYRAKSGGRNRVEA